MKSFCNKIMVLYLIAVLTVCSVVPAGASVMQSATAQEPHVYATSDKIESIINNASTSATLIEIIRTAVSNCEASVNIKSYNVQYSQELLNAFYTLIAYEIPEAFHVSKLSCTYLGEYFYELKFTYTCTAEEYAQMYNECITIANTLLNGIKGNTRLSDVEKALLLHDRLAVYFAYGDVYASRFETATLYGALTGRRPVCQGYAVTYSYLLNQVGIRSEMTSSDTLNHAWNIVYIDNKPYHVDVTWDDPTSDIYGRVMHNNFLLSTSALKTGVNGSSAHNADDFSTTPVSTTYDSYFWQDSEAAFQLLGNEIYYIDNEEQRIEKMSDHSAVVSVAGTWNINNSGTYLVGNHAKLACVNDVLYCSMPTAVYSVDVKNKTMTKFYTPDMTVDGTKYYSIQGFAYENNTMYFDFARYNSGYILTAKASASVPAVCDHKNTEYKNGYAATCGAAGKTDDLICSSCGTTITKGSTIPATGNHTWDEGNVILEPTTETTGIMLYTCTVCGATKESGIAVIIPPQTAFNYGDVNSDGAITSGDARLTLRASVGLETLTDTKKELADIDGDGTLTAGDARLILRYSVGLTDEWPR